MSEPLAGFRLMRMPRTVHLEVTAQCNARCRYCYFFNNPQVSYQDLPTSEWQRFIDELGSLGVMEVVLAGGEAFLRPDLAELIDRIVTARMRFSILTNGSLVTDSLATQIAATQRCNYVQVSIDGSRAQVHDRARGRGSFSAAVRGIQVLQRRGVPVTVRVTIHRHNLHDLENTARFLLEDLALPSFSTNAVGYLGSCQQRADELLLSVAEYSQAIETMAALNSRYPERITASAGPLAELEMWPRMIRQAAHETSMPLPSGRLTACGCPFSEITVRPDGAIVPCSMLPHVTLGRINQDTLQDVWRYSQVLNQMRMRRDIPLDRFDNCRSCSYSSTCTGGCPGMAYALTGEINAPSPDSCLNRFVECGGRLPSRPASIPVGGE